MKNQSNQIGFLRTLKEELIYNIPTAAATEDYGRFPQPNKKKLG